jgi:DNA invertase Pin-like site-specific DNA recombinase
MQVLRSRAEREGWEYSIFEEIESSRKTRPIKQQLLQQLREGKFDLVAFTRLDRFARSMPELVMDVEQLVNSGVRVVAVQQGLDFSKEGYNSMNQLQLQILAAFAQFERELIRERTLEGLARAKAQGKKLGRPRNLKNAVEIGLEK